MTGALRIAVTLPGNRFHGQEWPSSPSRLFRALLAGAMTGGYRDKWPEVEPALRWLEMQEAPEIEAVKAIREPGYRISVPNNDMDVAAREWRSGRPYDVSALRTLKSVEPWCLVDNQGPHLVYCWKGVSVDDQVLSGLREAANSLHTLGWGIDMAFADLTFGSDRYPEKYRSKWMPGVQNGKLLDVPMTGSLTDLTETYERFLNAVGKADVNPDTRPMVFRQERYGNGVQVPRHIYFDLHVIEGEDTFSRPAERGMLVAAWLRHAAGQALLEEKMEETLVNAVAFGHGEAPGRLSYVPIPSIGHPNADGRIRRVMIVEATDGNGELLRLLQLKLNGWVLTDEHGKEQCRLAVPLDQKTVWSSYTGESREWRTVTPLVLHGFNSKHGAISIRKTERLLGQAFALAGWDLANVESVAFQAAPFFNKTGGARAVWAPKHLDGWPRYHVAVTFREKVEGPLLAGLGRHYGLGVFGRYVGMSHQS